MGQLWLPFTICAFCGAVLAAIELLQTFGRWMGEHWLNRHVGKLVLLNVVTACAVYAIARFGLGVEDTLRLAIVTGLTFPAILRSKFTLFRAAGRDKDTPKELSIPLDTWYRNLQELCIEEVNSRIADSTARRIRQLTEKLPEQDMVDRLETHIEAEPHSATRQKHEEQLQAIKVKADAKKRARLLAYLMIEIMPEGTINELLKGGSP